MNQIKHRSRFLLIMILSLSVVVSLHAQQNLNINDVSGFQDSKHHWMDITDHEQVIVPSKDQQSYEPVKAREIADNILLYQQPIVAGRRTEYLKCLAKGSTKK